VAESSPPASQALPKHAGRLPDRKLILFPGFAVASSDDGEGLWNGLVAGVAVSARTKQIRRRFLIRMLGRLMDASPAELNTDCCRLRAEPFFLAPAKPARIRVQVGDQVLGHEPRSRRNGHFQARIADPLPADRLKHGEQPVTAMAPGHTARGRLHILPAEGVSVISDIDDTIKFSDVENRAELLANTFLRPFRPVRGMSDVYGWLASQGVRFHYVTASPWQLYRPLEEFMSASGFPAGSMHFRTFRLRDHLLKRLGVIHRSGKSRAVRRILARCPRRRFVLIGDSGERDPDIYLRCFRDHGESIQRILIRLIHPSHRYRETILKAKIALPSRVFATFESSEELGNLLAEGDLLK
jgi:phosphatidate phosphatase APP1